MVRWGWAAGGFGEGVVADVVAVVVVGGDVVDRSVVVFFGDLGYWDWFHEILLLLLLLCLPAGLIVSASSNNNSRQIRNFSRLKIFSFSFVFRAPFSSISRPSFVH